MKTNLIRSDFDRLAAFDDGQWSHNSHYHSYLLARLPASCDRALEVGSGTGTFARLLARRSKTVLALDLSPEMIRLAKERSVNSPNVEYLVADVMEIPFPEESYDAIVSIATLHHLPLELVLAKLKAALKPGGVLAVLDLYKTDTARGRLLDLAAIPISLLLGLWRNRRLHESLAARQAWAEHGKHDVYLPLSHVREIARGILPGVAVKRLLLWRYALIWKKPI